MNNNKFTIHDAQFTIIKRTKKQELRFFTEAQNDNITSVILNVVKDLLLFIIHYSLFIRFSIVNLRFFVATTKNP
jgi:hypothetical protein